MYAIDINMILLTVFSDFSDDCEFPQKPVYENERTIEYLVQILNLTAQILKFSSLDLQIFHAWKNSNSLPVFGFVFHFQEDFLCNFKN